MRSDGEPPVRVMHYALLALVMLMIMVSVVTSRRGILLSDLPDIVPVADIPARANWSELDRYMTIYPYYVPNSALRPDLATALERVTGPEPDRPRLGWSIRQVVFLGMPFWAYKEAGYVLYRRDAVGFRAAALGDDGVALLNRQAGAELTRGWIFPFWRVGWGWLAVLGAALFGWLEWRHQAWRRRAMGLI